MIPTPRGWRRVDVGADVLLLPPDERVGVIRYRERLQPLLPIAQLVTGQLADDLQFQVDTIEPPRTFVTLEGERAATVGISGTLDGAAVQRTFGYVLAEDFYARVSALSLAAETHAQLRAMTHELVKHVSLRLGARRRRPHYEPPTGWRAHAVGLRTDWITDEFPIDPSCLTVWPAVPGPPSAGPPPIANQTGVLGPWPVHTRHGLTGWSWRSDGRFVDQTPRRRDFVVLADGHYRYALRLETDLDHHEQRRSELLGVLDSLDPVPLEQRTSATGLQHWVD